MRIVSVILNFIICGMEIRKSRKGKLLQNVKKPINFASSFLKIVRGNIFLS